MSHRSNNGNGDHGVAARASLQARPSTPVRLDADVKALISLLGALSGRSFNACMVEAAALWLRAEAARLSEGSTT
jgi:hypothetical protein